MISEYGAAIWSDPHRWIPEAARVLRPGGQLAFLGNVLALLELYPPDDATTGYGFVDAAWATRWPSEECWKARKRS